MHARVLLDWDCGGNVEIKERDQPLQKQNCFFNQNN